MREEMVGRLAKVLAAEGGHPHSERHYQGLARRLLAAMREPTARMSNGLPTGYRPGSHSVREIWNGMIDGALGEARAPAADMVGRHAERRSFARSPQ